MAVVIKFYAPSTVEAPGLVISRVVECRAEVDSRYHEVHALMERIRRACPGFDVAQKHNGPIEVRPQTPDVDIKGAEARFISSVRGALLSAV